MKSSKLLSPWVRQVVFNVLDQVLHGWATLAHYGRVYGTGGVRRGLSFYSASPVRRYHQPTRHRSTCATCAIGVPAGAEVNEAAGRRTGAEDSAWTASSAL